MEPLEVDGRCVTAIVEEVLSQSHVSGACALLARVMGEAVYRDIAVGADQWLAVHECKADRLLDWLATKKAAGYALVGLEQATRSVRLGEVELPEQMVIVAGAELKGLPLAIINQLDLIVEIPQLGTVRSLNVHVATSLLVWEYTRQRLARVRARASGGGAGGGGGADGGADGPHA